MIIELSKNPSGILEVFFLIFSGILGGRTDIARVLLGVNRF